MVTPSQLNRRAALFEQLATMISAGVALPKAIDMVARNRNTGIPQRILQGVGHYLNEGHTLSDSLQLVSGQLRPAGASGVPIATAYTLSDFDVALLTAGEDSGKLDSSCRLLARYYASRAQLIRDTLLGMLITIVTVHVALLVVPIWGPLPQFVIGIRDGNYSQCVPYILWEILFFSLFYGFAWFMIFSAQGNRGEGWRSGVQAVTSVVPILGNALKYLALARLAMALNALLNAGVPVIRAWELASKASGSIELKRQIHRWSPELANETTPAEMIAQIRYFPEMFVNLYNSGEISGRIDESLAHLQTYFEDEGFRRLQYFCRIMMFVIYFTVAIGVGIFVIWFWTQYYGKLLNSL